MYALHRRTIIAAIQNVTLLTNMLNVRSDVGLVCGTLPVRIPTQFTVAIFDAVFSVFHSGRTECLKIGYSLP
jgi:hypothetical protein